jgi:hypothetical protein
LPFVCAEFLGVSGIVTLLFTAMLSQRYVLPNVSTDTEDAGEAVFKLLAHLSETSIFLILGISIIGVVKEAELHMAFFGWTCLACVVGRAIHVYTLSGLYNAAHSKKLSGGWSTRKSVVRRSTRGSNATPGKDDRDRDRDTSALLRKPSSGEEDEKKDEGSPQALGKGELILDGVEEQLEEEWGEGPPSPRLGGSGSFVFGEGSGQADVSAPRAKRVQG